MVTNLIIYTFLPLLEIRQKFLVKFILSKQAVLENVHFKHCCRLIMGQFEYLGHFFLQFETQGYCVLACSHISIFIFGNVLSTNDVCTDTCNATSRYILTIESWIENSD